MICRTVLRLMCALVLSVTLILSASLTALADAPSNDSFAGAIAISALPSDVFAVITDATFEDGEPVNCVQPIYKTLWYHYTAATDGWIRARVYSILGDYLTVYNSESPAPTLADLRSVGCAASWYDAVVAFEARAGTTYYFQAGTYYNYGEGEMHLELQAITPPANDDWANATAVTGLPFSERVDVTAATAEDDEPMDVCGGLNKSIWYAFTPQEDGALSAWVANTYNYPILVAYTGNSLSGLAAVAWRCGWGRLTFHVQAGMTYYFQVAGQSGDNQSWEFCVEVAPLPTACLYFSPGDPTRFDTVQFWDCSYDPGEAGIVSRTWDLGDGTTATDCCPSHQYTQDGDYTVQLTVTTADGRTASTSQTIHVATHDVAVLRFGVPQAARARQTRQISVEVKNSRYPENVEVQLYKSAAGGYQWVGTLNQTVPVLKGNRTTTFAFSYTFADEDAKLGKITFRAMASLQGARDALPADNEAISSPTKVSQ
jgi:PKD repeat protein